MQSSSIWSFSSARAKLLFAHSLESHLECTKLGKKKCKRRRYGKGVSSHSIRAPFDKEFSETSASSEKVGNLCLKKIIYDSSGHCFKERKVILDGTSAHTKISPSLERVFNPTCFNCRSCTCCCCFIHLEASLPSRNWSYRSSWKPGISSFGQQTISCCVFRLSESRRAFSNRALLPRSSKNGLGSGLFRCCNISYSQQHYLFCSFTNNVFRSRKLYPLIYAVYMCQYGPSHPFRPNWKEEKRYPRYFTTTDAASKHRNFDSSSVLKKQSYPLGGFSSSSDKIRRLAAISDIHVFDVDGFWNENILEFFNLRILGLLNILFLRGPERFSVQVLAKAIEDMHEMRIDHLILAGDITNLSLESEFATASKVVSVFGPPSTITAVPGNHDVYNRGELKRKLFQKYFGAYAVSDIPVDSPRGDGFPILQKRGNVALIGLNTALPGSARGMVGRRQWHAAEEMMERASHILNSVHLKVLVLHHPAQNPVVRGLPWIREIGHDLKDWKSVAQFCRKYSIDLVVHGHNHIPYQGLLDGSPHTLVCESGSGTLMTEQEDRVARYTVFELSEQGELERCFARVLDIQGECFRTKELILPPKSVPFAAT
jgi:3',5'-cyclic AMP phosphodiesterase CpdA